MSRYSKYFSSLLVLLFIGCGGGEKSSETISPDDNLEETQKEDENSENEIPLVDKLNNLRAESGLIRLTQNALLTQSSLNHAHYLSINDKSGHDEVEGYNLFTGNSPGDRTAYVGYQSTSVSENVSTGQESEELSLDGLMGAIYHRFGFLSFEIDEIGYAKYDKAYVYNMGNSNLNRLCEGESFEEAGKYYIGSCAKEDFKIEYQNYNDAQNSIIDSNPSYVIYPYSNQDSVTPAFYEESPDPLPNHGVSGFPISIEFNSNDFNMSKFTLNSFILKDSNLDEITLVEYLDGSSVMGETNDLNEKITKYQYVIFPQERLDYNRRYNASFVYRYDGEDREIFWSFTTKSLENLISYKSEDMEINLNKDYHIYFKPENQTDTITNYSISCNYEQDGSLDIEAHLYDANTINLTVNGSLVKNCLLTLNNNREITLNIK